MHLRNLIPPIFAQMPHSSTHAGSSSQPRPSSAPDSPRTPSSHGFEDQADPQPDAAVWKRRYLALKDTLNTNTQTSSKRKSG